MDAFGKPLTTLAESREEVRELCMCWIVVGNLIAEDDQNMVNRRTLLVAVCIEFSNTVDRFV